MRSKWDWRHACIVVTQLTHASSNALFSCSDAHCTFMLAWPRDRSGRGEVGDSDCVQHLRCQLKGAIGGFLANWETGVGVLIAVHNLHVINIHFLIGQTPFSLSLCYRSEILFTNLKNWIVVMKIIKLKENVIQKIIFNS